MDAVIPRPLVVPAPGSRLEQLLEMRDAAEAAVKTAGDTLDMIKDGIKAESAAAAAALLPPGTPLPPVIGIAGSAHRPSLTLRWCTPRRLNSKRLQREQPGVWEEYAEYGRGYWELRAG